MDTLVLEVEAASEVDTQAVHQAGTQSVPLAVKLAEPPLPKAVLKLQFEEGL